MSKTHPTLSQAETLYSDTDSAFVYVVESTERDCPHRCIWLDAHVKLEAELTETKERLRRQEENAKFDADHYRTEREEWRKQKAALEKLNAELHRTIACMNKEKAGLEATTWQREHAQGEIARKEWEKEKEELNREMVTTIAHMNKEKTELEAKAKEKLQREEKSACLAEAYFRRQCAEWEREKSDLNGMLRETTKEMESVKLELEKLNDDKEKLEATTWEREHAQKEIARKGWEKKELNDEITTLQKTFEAQNAEWKSLVKMACQQRDELKEKVTQLTEQLRATEENLRKVCQQQHDAESKVKLGTAEIEMLRDRLRETSAVLEESITTRVKSEMEKAARSTLAAINGDRQIPETVITIDEIDFLVWPIGNWENNICTPHLAVPARVMKSLFGIDDRYNLYYVRFSLVPGLPVLFSVANTHHDIGANITGLVNAARAAKK